MNLFKQRVQRDSIYCGNLTYGKQIIIIKSIEENSMNNKFIFIFTGVIVIMVVLSILKDSSLYVRLEKIDEVQVEKVLDGNYWHMVDENRIDYLQLFNLNTLNYDLTAYNIVISDGREIVKMKYKRERAFPFKVTNYTKTVLGKEFHPNTLFIYKIDKNDKVYLDEQGLTMDIIIQN